MYDYEMLVYTYHTSTDLCFCVPCHLGITDNLPRNIILGYGCYLLVEKYQ